MAKKGNAPAPTDDEVLDVLSPSAEPVQWKIGTESTNTRVYTQKPLSYFRKMHFFALVGSTIRQALAVSGEGSLNDIVGPALGGRTDNLSVQDFADAESFIAVASSLAVYVPDFLEDAYVIWLGVPLQERQWAKATMALPEDEGGLSDEDGVGIIRTFIDQNWDAITDFFVGEIPSLIRAVTERTNSTEEDSTKTEETEQEEVSIVG